MEHEMKQNFIELAKKYDFQTEEADEAKKLVYLLAKNTDGELTKWIAFHYQAEAVGILGNTDHLNLWFHQTRPDLTPDKLMEFTRDLNEALGMTDSNKIMLRELVDPEDWQEIANIRDAHADSRYLES